MGSGVKGVGFSQAGRSFQGQEFLRAMFPLWKPEELREMVSGILVLAEPTEGEPIGENDFQAWCSGAGRVWLNFDGRGGVSLNPKTDCSPKMVQLVDALEMAMGSRFTLGNQGGERG